MPSEFEELFLFMFKNDPGAFDPDTYEVLNTCFVEVDAFCEDAALRALTLDGIGADQLRQVALVARDRLTRSSGVRMDQPGLADFLSGYFHQDWDLEAASPRELIETFVGTEDPRLIARVDREIELLLERCANDDELADVLIALGSCYDPRASGVSPAEWLAGVRQTIARGRASAAEG